MAAYILANYTIDDPKGYENYVPGVLPLLMKHGAEVLVADFGTTAIEGTPHTVSIVLRFVSEDAAMAWYNDPEYTPVKGLRLASTTGSLWMAKEFVMPS